jgi:hypothetical protein
MEERARAYLFDNAPAPAEDVIPAMTVTGDLRRARRVLRDMCESGVVEEDEDGLLSLNFLAAAVWGARRQASEE